ALTSLGLISAATWPTESYTLSLHDALPISVASLARTSTRTPLALSSATLPMSLAAIGASLTGVTVIVTVAVSDLKSLTRGEPLRSEEHTSELQSRRDFVCRLLLEKRIFPDS